MFHVIVNANSIVQHVIQIKNTIIKHVDMNIKVILHAKRNHSLNPSTCIFENGKYLNI